MENEKNEKKLKSIHLGIFNNIDTLNFKKIENGNMNKINLTDANFKDLKEIIDKQNSSKNKPFILLVKKRVRETEEIDQKKDKFIENFNNLSLCNMIIRDKEIFSQNTNDESKNEVDQKVDIFENIKKTRHNRVFSKTDGLVIKCLISEEDSNIYRSFYPRSTSKQFFMQEKQHMINDEIQFREQSREKDKQEEFWERRKFLKGQHDPDFEKVKLIYHNLYGENDTQYINLDLDNMVIVRNGDRLKAQ